MDVQEEAPDPIHWCDAFRELADINTADPRMLSRSVIDSRAEVRAMVLQDRWNDLTTVALHDGVPASVRIHFDTARNLLLFSWFVYRFQQVAEMHAFGAVECALRIRDGVRSNSIGPGLRRLLKRAVEAGWLRDDGFRNYRQSVERLAAHDEMSGLVTGSGPMPEVVDERRYVKIVCEAIPALRNELAHGSPVAALSGLRTLALCSDLINQLFEPAP